MIGWDNKQIFWRMGQNHQPSSIYRWWYPQESPEIDVNDASAWILRLWCLIDREPHTHFLWLYEWVSSSHITLVHRTSRLSKDEGFMFMSWVDPRHSCCKTSWTAVWWSQNWMFAWVPWFCFGPIPQLSTRWCPSCSRSCFTTITQVYVLHVSWYFCMHIYTQYIICTCFLVYIGDSINGYPWLRQICRIWSPERERWPSKS